MRGARRLHQACERRGPPLGVPAALLRATLRAYQIGRRWTSPISGSGNRRPARTLAGFSLTGKGFRHTYSGRPPVARAPPAAGDAAGGAWGCPRGTARAPGAGGGDQPGQAMETMGQLGHARQAARSPAAGGWTGREAGADAAPPARLGAARLSGAPEQPPPGGARLLPAGILRAGGGPLPRLDPQAHRASRGTRPERSAGLPAAEGITP